MKKNINKIRVGFISLGCPKNQVDSEHMISRLLSDGLSLVQELTKADVIVVNTCAFIDSAREESVRTIETACEYKETSICKYVIVTGCLPQRYRKELITEDIGVDAFIGLDELDSLPVIIKSLFEKNDGVIYNVTSTAHKVLETPERSLFISGGVYAYVKIAEGCNHQCGFCAIPSIRGRYRSRTMDSIVCEVEALLAKGVREINLVSQDTTYYGYDLQDDSNIANLVKRLGSLGDNFWIRLLYGHPAHVTDELLDAIGSTSQVCQYLDIPVQHSHPEMLKLMHRVDRSKYRVSKMASEIRKVLPDVALRTTFVVGYPGEKKEHFDHLMHHICEVRYDHAGAFEFSPEENTPAFNMTGKVLPKTAHSRYHKLMTEQQMIVMENNAGLVDSSDVILIEKPDASNPGVWIGRSKRQAPEVDSCVFVEGLPKNKKWGGEFVSVMYKSFDGYDMIADYSRGGKK